MIRHADFDLIQVFIVVIAVVAGFLNWLWKLIQQTKAEHERRAKQPEDPHERHLREEAWRRQVGQSAGKPYRPPPTATAPPGGDPFQTVRDIFRKQLAEEAERRARRETPPPLPQTQSPPVQPHQQPARRSDSGTVRAEVYPAPLRSAPPAAAEPELARPVVIAPAPPQAATPPVRFPTAPAPPLMSARRLATPAATLSPLAAALPAPSTLPDIPRRERPDIAALMSRMREPAALRQAVLLREILGPPKALQSLTEAPS